MPQTDKLTGLTRSCENCGWFFPHAAMCWASDRHSTVHFDDRGSLHSDDGPSIAYRDGWQIFHSHGVRVDEQIVRRPETQTITQIDSEENAEVKRVRIERFGWERYLRESGSEVVDERFNERDQQAERLYRTRDGIRRVIVSDPSTGRRYALGVPREVSTCEQAQNFLSHGLDRRAIHRS